MKKILFLLLFSTGFLQAQTLQNPTYGNTTTNTLKIKTPTTVTNVNFLSTNEADGSVSKIAPINVTIPYTPVNYTASTQSIGSHLSGIDTRLGQISSTTAGITQRVYFTADNTTVNSVVYFASSLTGKGSTATGSPSALVLPDNTKGYFTKDVISVAQPSATIGYAGTYSGNLTVSATPTPVATQQRFTVEIYRTNNLGVPIASGVSGAPTGDLGVTVLAILDSGIINLTAGSITNVPVSGILTQNVTINTGERLRYHVSAAKIGTGGGSVTFGVYYGNAYNSYYDVPVAITTDAVLNKSTNTGVTSTDALNALNTGKQPVENQRLSTTNNVTFNSVTAVNSATINNLAVGINNEQTDADIVVREKTTGEYGKASKETLKNIIGIGGDFASTASITLYQGDSMTFGEPPATPYPNLVSTTNSYDKVNNAVGGKTISTIRSQAETIDDIEYRFQARENVYVLWAGTNDLATGSTVDEAFRNFQATCRERRNKGWKVIVLTTLQRCGNNPTGTPLNTLIPQYNALIRAGWSTFADGIADVAADPTLSPINACTDTFYFNGDGVHLTTAGNTIIASVVSEAINNISKTNNFQNMSVIGNFIKPITVRDLLGATKYGLIIGNDSALSGNMTGILFNAWNNGYGYRPVASIEAVSNGASAGQSDLYIKVNEHGGTEVGTVAKFVGSTKNLEVTGTVKASPATLSTELVTKGQLDAAIPSGIKRYKALISQTGTSAPTVVTVLENSLGTVNFTYSAVGNFQATSSGLFTSGKTYRYIGQGANANTVVSLDSANTSTLNIWVKEVSSSTYVNGLSNIPILIEVYP